jgi:hypothetical protein
VEPFDYGWNMASDLLVFTYVIFYSVMSPLTLLFGSVYFISGTHRVSCPRRRRTCRAVLTLHRSCSLFGEQVQHRLRAQGRVPVVGHCLAIVLQQVHPPTPPAHAYTRC